MTETQDCKEAIAPELTPLEQLNLDVAAIAGWENIRLWDTSRNQEVQPKRRMFTGTNKKHPELGVRIPDYTSDLNAIAKALELMGIDWSTSSRGYALNLCTPSFKDGKPFIVETYGQTPAIALCKLLLQLVPKPEPQVQVIDDDGDIDEPTVIEAIMQNDPLAPNDPLTAHDICVLVAGELGLDWLIRLNEYPLIGTFEVLAERCGQGIGLAFPTLELSTRSRDSFKWEIKSRLMRIMGRSVNG